METLTLFEQPDIVSQILEQDNRGIHNFSYGTLDCYFWLQKLLTTPGKSASFPCPGILVLDGLPGTNRVKTFVFGGRAHSDYLFGQQHRGVVYSIDPLPLQKESKFKEMQYHLPDVFNPSNYSREKRKMRLRYPFNWLETNGLTTEPCSEENFGTCKAIHDEWVQKKLSDPKTFQMMFPNKRYLNCVSKAIEQPDRYEAVLFYLCGKPFAVEVYAVQGKHAFGMAGFGKWWEFPSQAMNFVTVWMLRHLQEKGIEYVNDGATLNKNLHAFKSHYPNNLIISYAYSKLKEGE